MFPKISSHIELSPLAKAQDLFFEFDLRPWSADGVIIQRRSEYP